MLPNGWPAPTFFLVNEILGEKVLHIEWCFGEFGTKSYERFSVSIYSSHHENDVAIKTTHSDLTMVKGAELMSFIQTELDAKTRSE